MNLFQSHDQLECKDMISQKNLPFHFFDFLTCLANLHHNQLIDHTFKYCSLRLETKIE